MTDKHIKKLENQIRLDELGYEKRRQRWIDRRQPDEDLMAIVGSPETPRVNVALSAVFGVALVALVAGLCFLRLELALGLGALALATAAHISLLILRWRESWDEHVRGRANAMIRHVLNEFAADRGIGEIDLHRSVELKSVLDEEAAHYLVAESVLRPGPLGVRVKYEDGPTRCVFNSDTAKLPGI